MLNKIDNIRKRIYLLILNQFIESLFKLIHRKEVSSQHNVSI